MMRRRFLFGILCSLFVVLYTTNACDCGPGSIDEHFRYANIAFAGKVIAITETAGTGARQKRFVHFQIEELFKGLSPDVLDIWIDPSAGRFGCTFEYVVGTRYVVFADLSRSPFTGKPLAIAIDSDNRKIFYRATECSGTEAITSATKNRVSREIKYLRKLREGVENDPTDSTPD
jgi:hypothetical protein